MSILLDDAESADTYRQLWFEGTTDELPSMRVRQSIVKAQAKKIYEWGNEDCPHTHDILLHIYSKRQCEECWQVLYEEIK